MCHSVQAVSQREQVVDGNKALRNQDGADLVGQLPPHLLAFRGGLFGTCEQINDLILGELRFVGRGPRQLSERASGGVEKLRQGLDPGKWIDDLLPGGVPICRWDLSLPGQDLPKSEVRLKNTEGLGPHFGVRDMVKPLRPVDKAGDGVIVQSGEFGKDGILVSELPELLRQ